MALPRPCAVVKVNMLLPKKRLLFLSVGRLCPALLFGLLLASADYWIDSLGTGASKTILKSLAIGALGGSASFFYLKARCQECAFEIAKERMSMIGHLNRGIRGALGAVAASALYEDSAARLKSVDEAIDRIDTFLCDLRTCAKIGEQEALPVAQASGTVESAARRIAPRSAGSSTRQYSGVLRGSGVYSRKG